MAVSVAKPLPSLSVAWSDGSLFNGSIYIGIVPPQFSGADSPSIDWNDWPELVELPTVYPININNGTYDPTLGVFYSNQVSPPNVRYVCWFGDRNGNIFGPSAQFQVTAATFTPPAVTLTVPTVGINNPSFNV